VINESGHLVLRDDPEGPETVISRKVRGVATTTAASWAEKGPPLPQPLPQPLRGNSAAA
jgi:hypothetical protein